ncbi:MAG: hypothetical protein AAFX94_00345, partial [Myxococcota bacterium]
MTGWKGKASIAVWLVVAAAVAATPGARAVADTVARETLGARPLPAVLTTPRDPVDFLADIEIVMPAPVVVRTREDAVARELLNYNKTLDSQDVMRSQPRPAHGRLRIRWPGKPSEPVRC